MGSGLGRKGAVVRWSTAGRMAAAWVLTLPAAGLVAACAALLANQGTWGITAVAVLALAAGTAIRIASRRKPIDHTDVTEAGTGAVEEPPGVVTTAIAAVGGDLKATIPAPAPLTATADPAQAPA
jgi:PiT family inorganic phosphate transporter